MRSALLTREVSGQSPATQAGPRRCIHLCSVISNMDAALFLHWGEVENAKFTRSIWHSKCLSSTGSLLQHGDAVRTRLRDGLSLSSRTGCVSQSPGSGVDNFHFLFLFKAREKGHGIVCSLCSIHAGRGCPGVQGSSWTSSLTRSGRQPRTRCL